MKLLSKKALDLQPLSGLPSDFPLITVVVELHSLAELINDNVELETILAPSELKHFLEFKILKRKTEWLGGRIAAKIAFSRLCPSAQLNSIIIQNKPNGAPVINQPQRHRGTEINDWQYLSISHSGNYAIAVISKYPVGIDIEEIVPRDPVLYSIAFTKYETELINFFDREQKDEYVTRLWTCKEALLKVLQKGLTVDLNNIEIYLNKDGKADFKINSINKGLQPLVKSIEYEVIHFLKNISLFTLKKETYIISIAVSLESVKNVFKIIKLNEFS